MQRVAAGVAAVVGVGQLGTFVINSASGLGLPAVAAAVTGLVTAVIAGLIIFYSRRRRN